MSRASMARASFRKLVDETPISRRERKEREHDEQIVCAIVALATDRDHKICASSVLVRSGVAFINHGLAGIPFEACAVGAGLLYRGVESDGSALESFAEQYDVTRSYAIGVSDGFEAAIGATIGYDPRDYDEADEDLLEDPNNDRDYERGWAVGSAIATAVRA